MRQYALTRINPLLSDDGAHFKDCHSDYLRGISAAPLDCLLIQKTHLS